MTTVEATAHSTRLLQAERPLAFVQWAAIAGSIAVLVWSVPGIIVNPDFSIGDSATSEKVLGVDMNGWHALSGFLLAMPGFYAALRRSWAGLFNLAAAGGLIATAAWALASEQVVGGLIYLPDGGADAIFHLATSSIFIAGAVQYYVFGDRLRHKVAATSGRPT